MDGPLARFNVWDGRKWRSDPTLTVSCTFFYWQNGCSFQVTACNILFEFEMQSIIFLLKKIISPILFITCSFLWISEILIAKMILLFLDFRSKQNCYFGFFWNNLNKNRLLLIKTQHFSILVSKGKKELMIFLFFFSLSN